MIKKSPVPRRSIKPCIVCLEKQFYGQLATGQMVRIDPQGQQISRIRMSKKERLRLRKELYKINEIGSHELANKIVESMASNYVVNPKSEEQLKAEQGESEGYA
jgi:hypothetical protein